MEKQVTEALQSGNITYMFFSSFIGMIFIILKYGDTVADIWKKYVKKEKRTDASVKDTRDEEIQKLKERVVYYQEQIDEMQEYIDANLKYVNDLIMIKNHPLKTYISGMGLFVRFPNTLRVDSMESFTILLEAFEGNARSFDSPDRSLTIDFTDVKNFNSTATGALYEFYTKIKKKGGIRLKYIFLRGNKNHEFHYNNIISVSSTYKNDYASVILTDRDYSAYLESIEEK